jgi:hypothetical protein
VKLTKKMAFSIMAITLLIVSFGGVLLQAFVNAPTHKIYDINREGFKVMDLVESKMQEVECSPALDGELSLVGGCYSFTPDAKSHADVGAKRDGNEVVIRFDIITKSEGTIRVAIPWREAVILGQTYNVDGLTCVPKGTGVMGTGLSFREDYSDSVDFDVVLSGYSDYIKYTCPCWCVGNKFERYCVHDATGEICGNERIELDYTKARFPDQCVDYAGWNNPWENCAGESCCTWIAIQHTGTPFKVCEGDLFFFRKSMEGYGYLNGFDTVSEALLIDNENRFAVQFVKNGQLSIRFSEEFIEREEAMTPTTTTTTTIPPKCSTASDCMDEVHPLCLGYWICDGGKCRWICDGLKTTTTTTTIATTTTIPQENGDMISWGLVFIAVSIIALVYLLSGRKR